LLGIGSSVLRYVARDDGNAALREGLRELAGQHRRHGYRMLHARLVQEGRQINVKRTYRLYTLEGLTVRKRRRKKLPSAERQPLTRPERPNEVWTMDFVFDELACGRRMKALTVVDDCSKEAVQIAADSSIPALRHAASGRGDRPTRQATLSQKRQQTGVCRASLASLGCRACHRASFHPAGQTDTECLRRKFQRSLSRRMPFAALFCQSAPHAQHLRQLARRLQRTPTAQ